MDINTIKLERDSLKVKADRKEQSHAKKDGKSNITRGCLKMLDYTTF